jgi:hypothetical protein
MRTQTVSRLRQCVILWVTLIAVTGVLRAAEPNGHKSPPKGREIVMSSEQATPPLITSFFVHAGLYGIWILEGTIVHETPSKCTVVFDGLLAGHRTSVHTDGTFSYSVTLPSGTDGFVTAQAFDPEGTASNLAFLLMGGVRALGAGAVRSSRSSKVVAATSPADCKLVPEMVGPEMANDATGEVRDGKDLPRDGWQSEPVRVRITHVPRGVCTPRAIRIGQIGLRGVRRNRCF